MTAVLDRVIGRLRGGARERERYDAFVAHVEPALAARSRVHRFAVPPLLGDKSTTAAPLAVVIDPSDGGDVAVTRASLERQTVAPAAVAEGVPATALGEPGPPHMAIVAAGDVLAPRALERLGQAFTLAPDAALVTCDDDELDGAGRRRAPRCAPGPSPDLLLEHPAAGALVAVARAAAAAAAQSGPGWRYELALLLTGPDGAGAAHVPQLLCHRSATPSIDDDAALRAAERALAAWGDAGASVEAAGEGRLRVRRAVRGEPSVEAIVCTRDSPALLERCAHSLLSDTAYDRLTLRIIDNAGSDPDGAALLRRLDADPRVTVQRDERPFNFAALNDTAAAGSGADVLAFVNDDVAFSDPAWLQTLLEHAQRPAVGAVAPLLLYPEGGAVQHAGAALGLHGWAGHPFAGLRPGTATPFGTAAAGTRNWLAVSAACLVVERAKYAAAGGLDTSFAVGGNDVDLCLRLTAAGHRSLCVPHAVALHDESATRDPLAVPAADHEASRRSYGEFRTIGDPFYNPNLTLAHTDCGMREPGEPVPPA